MADRLGNYKYLERNGTRTITGRTIPFQVFVIPGFPECSKQLAMNRKCGTRRVCGGNLRTHVLFMTLFKHSFTFTPFTTIYSIYPFDVSISRVYRRVDSEVLPMLNATNCHDLEVANNPYGCCCTKSPLITVLILLHVVSAYCPRFLEENCMSDSTQNFIILSILLALLSILPEL